MKESSNRRSVIVGLFIVIGLLIVIAGVLTLGGQKKAFVKAVRVTAIFKDIGGVQTGNNVWYSGVKVGNVKRITFLEHDKIEVALNIEESSAKFIHKDVVAKVGSDGLVGNKIIALSGGSDNMPGIQDGDQLKVAVNISPDEIMSTLQENNKNLLGITGNLNALSKKILNGEGSIGKLVNDESLYSNMSLAVASLQKSANNTERLTQNLAAYAASLRKEGTLANDLVTDTTIFRNLRSAVTQMNAVANNANEVVANLKSTTQGLNENLNSANSPVGVLLNDKQSGEELKQMLKNLNVSTGKLNEDLEAAQHNFLLRGYFKKKAKREEKARQDSIKNAQK
ncbi:MlaD family protein [Chitinophaga ginsengisoli]|uniref:Phospholipid/cholesterol/gamma-HCH transport system substrate-binding protein n=1 Tax=Chitinophaga ginsengisoli TaxID=363837 RepID=A0A2P8FVZ0_9BACT|nr:MlaD family protein [Chitinophaga ginsengisoli]PSL25805.1 phospholipid/cholesterol/gamma-HCH transport system substrate-binding protein [Chitinophaga ginsengisoli]